MASHYPICDGAGDSNGDHCCYVRGEPCQYLVVNGPTGRKYACGLRETLGSWDAVHADPGYLANVRPAWEEFGVADCGDWWGATYERALELKAEDDATLESVVDQVAQCCFRRRYLDGNTRLRRDIRVTIRGLLNDTGP